MPEMHSSNARARWDSLPAEPGAAWHPVDLGRQAVTRLPDMFTTGYFVALGEPVGIKPTKNEWEQDRADRRPHDGVRGMLAKAAPIVAAGRLVTELRGFAPDDGELPVVGLLTPGGDYMTVDKGIVTWFKRQFPGCLFYLGEQCGPIKKGFPMVAVAHDAWAEPVGLIAGCRNWTMPGDGQPCELSMPANAPIAKAYRPARPATAIKPARRPAGEAKAGRESRDALLERVEALAASAPVVEEGQTVVIRAGACSYRLIYDRATLEGFAKRLRSCIRPEYPGELVVEIVEPATFCDRIAGLIYQANHRDARQSTRVAILRLEELAALASGDDLAAALERFGDVDELTYEANRRRVAPPLPSHGEALVPAAIMAPGDILCAGSEYAMAPRFTAGERTFMLTAYNGHWRVSDAGSAWSELLGYGELSPGMAGGPCAWPWPKRSPPGNPSPAARPRASPACPTSRLGRWPPRPARGRRARPPAQGCSPGMATPCPAWSVPARHTPPGMAPGGPAWGWRSPGIQARAARHGGCSPGMRQRPARRGHHSPGMATGRRNAGARPAWAAGKHVSSVWQIEQVSGLEVSMAKKKAEGEKAPEVKAVLVRMPMALYERLWRHVQREKLQRGPGPGDKVDVQSMILAAVEVMVEGGED